jgi:hypothetical protein
MAATHPSYGTPNWELIHRWLQLPPDEDGPFWALNLMKYRPVAAYDGADGDGPRISGREADDEYAPLGPLAAIGAEVAFHGDVTGQVGSTPAWDRVGIVRYPTRAAFFAMQQRDDFKAKHVHKEAGMEATIVLACLPAPLPAAPADGTDLVLTVARSGERVTGPGIEPVADLTVEGVIVGDDRTWTHARFDRAADPDARARLQAGPAGTEEAFVLVVDPAIDRLVETIGTQDRDVGDEAGAGAGATPGE